MPQPSMDTALLRGLRARLRLEEGLGVTHVPATRGMLRRIEALWRNSSLQPAAAEPPPMPANSGGSESRPVPDGEASPVPHPHTAPEAGSTPDLSSPVRPSSPPGHVSLVPFVDPPLNPDKQALLAQLQERCMTCTRCTLCERRNNVAWGEGDLDAEILFIGEGPGRDEDREGRPFVGRSGRLLTDIIEKGMKIPRNRVYITNMVKCRPPGNRDPRPDEVAACAEYLSRQIAVIAPKIIVAVGAVAGRGLLDLPAGTGGLRKRWHAYHGTPLRVIFHPSYLLRQRQRENERSDADRETWKDVQEIMAKLASL